MDGAGDHSRHERAIAFMQSVTAGDLRLTSSRMSESFCKALRASGVILSGCADARSAMGSSSGSSQVVMRNAVG